MINHSCVWMPRLVLLLTCLGAIAGFAQPRALPDSSEQATLLPAFGYASCYNLEGMDEITSEVLAAGSEEAKARARWVRAYGYLRFMLDYRSQRYLDAFYEDYDELARTSPDLLKQELDRLYIMMQYYVPDSPTTESQVRGTYELCARYIADRDTSASIGAAHRSFLEGINNQYAGRMLCSIGQPFDDQYKKAKTYLSDGHEKQPDNYEYAAHLKFLLQESNDTTGAAAITKKLVAFPTKGWGFYETQPGMCDPAPEAGIACRDPFALVEQMKADVATNEDPEKLYSIVQNSLNNIHTVQSELGWPWLRALISSRYHAMTILSGAGHYTSAEGAAALVQELSPHYAGIHVHKAVIYHGLSTQADGADKERYRKMALEEFALQMDFNYMGTAVNEARDFLQKFIALSADKPSSGTATLE